MSSRIVYKRESYRIVGACFEVYRDKGSGFLEAVYHECLAIELAERNIPFLDKPQIPLGYKGQKPEQEYHPDFLCYDRIILEIKAVRTLAGEHRAQVIKLPEIDREVTWPLGELWALPQSRVRTVCESVSFACFAYFVVEPGFRNTDMKSHET